MTSFTGGCVCGAVRYEVKAAPIAMFKCHCRTCQMSTGSGYTPVVLVLRKALRFTQGTLAYYETNTIKEGKNKRGFCATCGSRISGAESERWLGITASSLDNPALFKSQFDIFTSHVQPWDYLDPESIRHLEYAP